MNTVEAMVETITDEVKQIAALSKQYIETINTAKTETKKNVFKKKLRKNNVKLARALQILNKWDQRLPESSEVDETSVNDV